MSVFQISKEDVARSSTLTKRDIGKWAMVVCGCIQIIKASNQEEAIEAYRYIMRK